MNNDTDDPATAPDPEATAPSRSAKRLRKLWLRDAKPRAEPKAAQTPNVEPPPSPEAV